MDDFQNSFLEDYLRRNDHPNGPQRDFIASQLNLDTDTIYTWFHHAREKYRRANNPS
ncbi:hypothetical protein L226DRAFT_539627 [Lentinus tigrinus ALCF2SS1-7]|uniref:uncharacterized protein n=1 Tax=Lentinus tigrinus ALCF2SS1-7 TaxID=1328758 RepID=UPI001165DCF9|nr:hypothetical protein L226DRAFT_539627 [Lentinus tigrinus ALCF2SS1-7]